MISLVAVTIRRATHDDVDALLALREEVAGEGVWIAAELPLDVEGAPQVWSADGRRSTSQERYDDLVVILGESPIRIRVWDRRR